MHSGTLKLSKSQSTDQTIIENISDWGNNDEGGKGEINLCKHDKKWKIYKFKVLEKCANKKLK